MNESKDVLPGPVGPGMNRTLAENIAAMAERRRREKREAPRQDRIADAITGFVGSMRFVALHLLLYGGWILVNAVPLGVPRFDPSFVTLAMTASVEAIFLSTFVLISQNRMTAAADRRADLDLHINLLAEHELSRLATLVERMAERLGVAPDDPTFEEIKKDVQPDEVMDAIDRQKPDSPA